MIGARSAAFEENWMMATGTRMTNTQKEACLDMRAQLDCFFGGLDGIWIGIKRDSLCTANGGSFPRDRGHNQQGTPSVHQIRRTWRRTVTLRRCVYEAGRKSPATAASARAAAPSTG